MVPIDGAKTANFEGPDQSGTAVYSGTALFSEAISLQQLRLSVSNNEYS